MTILKKIDSGIDKILATMCVFFLVLLFILLSFNVIFRFIPVYSMGWFDEIVELSFTNLSFFGAAFLWRRREHSRIDFLSEKYEGSKIEFLIELVVAVIGLVFVFFMVKYSLVLIGKATAWSPIFKIPRKIFYASIPISGIIMGIYAIRDILNYGKKLLRPSRSKNQMKNIVTD